ncbi:unnamed protein product [Adineta ricciae]|uniref:Bulb-type lectin domain-containing protein n=1 Tax=Adineta ricciae TaxID=249248 RepID=A0A814EI57_ADIRI|nr:unnamed protein product [Adineta ricciae]
MLMRHAESTTTSSTSTTTVTIPTPPFCLCANVTSSVFLYNNQFIYSPTSRTYAVGMLNNPFGVCKALAVYTASANIILWTANTNKGGYGEPFCLNMLDTGILMYVDGSGSTI